MMDIVKILKIIRPGAKYVLDGDSYEGLIWLDQEQDKPLLEEVQQMQQQLTLIVARETKLNEINFAAESEYVSGFYSDATGTSLRYDSDTDTQQLLNSLYLLATAAPDKFDERVFYPSLPAGQIPIRAWVWDADKQQYVKQIFVFNKTMVIALNDDLSAHLAAVKSKVWDKQGAVLNATSVAEINAVRWI